MKKKSQDCLLRIILILCFVGLFTSLYLIKHHYDLLSGATSCHINETISCDVVNGSTYAELFRVPVAVFGSLWFVVLIFMAFKALEKKDLFVPAMIVWSIVGFGFVGYLMWVEILLRALCPYCTIVHLLVIAIFLMILKLYNNFKNKKSWKEVAKKLNNWIIAILILYLIPYLLFNLY